MAVIIERGRTGPTVQQLRELWQREKSGSHKPPLLIRSQSTQEAAELVREGSVGDLATQFEGTQEATTEVGGFLTLSIEQLSHNTGVAESFYKKVKECMNTGFGWFASIRGKAWDELNSGVVMGIPKPMSMKAKTMSKNSASSGKCTPKQSVLDSGSYDDSYYNTNYPEMKKFVYNEHGKKKQLFLTHERQNLEYIRQKLITGWYTFVAAEGNCVVIKDRAGELYKIDLGSIEQEESIARSRYATTAFLSERGLKQVKSASGKSRRNLLRAPKRGSLNNAVKSYAAEQKLNMKTNRWDKALSENGLTSDLNLSVTLVPCNSDFTLKNDGMPRIVCNEERIPYVGDADQQHAFVSKDLSPKFRGRLKIKDRTIESVRQALRDLLSEKCLNKSVNMSVRDNIREAVRNLGDYRAQFSDNEIVDAIGGINITTAIYKLAGKTTDWVQHGDEDNTPIPFDDIKTTSIPSPHSKLWYCTHGENEYLDLLHRDEAILNQAGVNWHPARFVLDSEVIDSDGEIGWRRDTSDIHADPVTGKVKRRYANFTQQESSIKKWQSLFVKELLWYHANKPEWYKDEIETIRSNMEDIQRSSLKGENGGWEKTIANGIATVENLIKLCDDAIQFRKVSELVAAISENPDLGLADLRQIVRESPSAKRRKTNP